MRPRSPKVCEAFVLFSVTVDLYCYLQIVYERRYNGQESTENERTIYE